MKFHFFNLYNFIQVNLNRIFFSICVCVFEKAEAQRNTRKDKEEKKLLLINLAMFIICMVFMLYSVAIKQTESSVFV